MKDFFDELRFIGVDKKSTLERFVEDEEMYFKYVRKFPEDPNMVNLVNAVEKEDYHEAEVAVHTLKGICKNLGFTKLADTTEDMLDELRDDNIEDALEAYEELKVEYNKVCKVIEEWYA